MKLINQSAKLITHTADAWYTMERAARTCTATRHLMRKDLGYLSSIVRRKHYSILEHTSVTVELVTSRAIANQIVRHRIAAYSQESMRYVKLTRKDGGLPVIKPYNFDNWTPAARDVWEAAINQSEDAYKKLLNTGIKAEDARGVLPLDTATFLIATWNLRELFHILHHPVSGRLTNKHAQPQTRELFAKLEEELKENLPQIHELAELYKEMEK